MPDSVTPKRYILHIPRDFLDSLILRVSPRAVCVYLVLEGFRCGATESCFPGLERVAKQSGCSVRNVKRAMAELVKAGVIERQRRYGTSNLYTLRRESNGPDLSPSNGPNMAVEDIPVLTDTSISHSETHLQGCVASRGQEGTLVSIEGAVAGLADRFAAQLNTTDFDMGD